MARVGPQRHRGGGDVLQSCPVPLPVETRTIVFPLLLCCMLTELVRSTLAVILCTLLARRPIMSHAGRSEVNRESSSSVSLN